jgi:amidase
MGPADPEVMHGAAVQGVVSRTVRDTAAMFDVLAGGELAGPYEPAMPAEPLAGHVGADPGRLRIGVRVHSLVLTFDPRSGQFLDAALCQRARIGRR